MQLIIELADLIACFLAVIILIVVYRQGKHASAERQALTEATRDVSRTLEMMRAVQIELAELIRMRI